MQKLIMITFYSLLISVPGLSLPMDHPTLDNIKQEIMKMQELRGGYEIDYYARVDKIENKQEKRLKIFMNRIQRDGNKVQSFYLDERNMDYRLERLFDLSSAYFISYTIRESDLINRKIDIIPVDPGSPLTPDRIDGSDFNYIFGELLINQSSTYTVTGMETCLNTPCYILNSKNNKHRIWIAPEKQWLILKEDIESQDSTRNIRMIQHIAMDSTTGVLYPAQFETQLFVKPDGSYPIKKLSIPTKLKFQVTFLPNNFVFQRRDFDQFKLKDKTSSTDQDRVK